MAFLWSASSFNYYMIAYLLKYIHGNIYINTISSSFSEVVAYGVGGLFMQYLGTKKAFISCFLISLAGALLLIFIDPKSADNVLLAVFVLITKFGISATFVMVFIVTPQLFPSNFGATMIGICNIFARSISIASPEVAEVHHPVPMILFAAVALGACFAAFSLRLKGTSLS